MADPHSHLLARAAELAVAEFQAGAATPSVEDILHLEKRWAKLPGASAGGVSLEDATALLGAEVLADAPLEFVVAQVLGKGAGSGAPPVLTKRQFLNLAHVAEVAQGKAFDLVTAEDALRSQELPATHKKRPPAIREAGIDSWQISAAPLQHPEGEGAEGEYDAAAALAAGAPGRLSRATSLTLAAGPLQHGAKALSRQNSFSSAAGDDAAGAAGAPLRSARRQLHNLQSNATSYESAVEMHSDAEREEAAAAAAAGSPGQAGRLLSIPPTPEGPAADDTAGAEAGEGEAPPSAKLRKSWESFGGTTPKPGADGTPAAGGQQVNEAVVAAAMAAGMEFMRHLQAAGVAGGAQPSPFADINPLRAAAAAAAAAAASPALSAPSFAGVAPSAVAASPDVHSHSGSAGAAAGGSAVVPQQMIAQIMARMNLGEDASAEELAAAAAQLQQQAVAKQQRQRAAGSQPAASLQGSVGSAPSGGERGHSSQAAAGSAGEAALRKSWNAFKEDAPQYLQAKPQAPQQQQQQPAGSASTSPQKQPGRMGPPPPASPAVTRLVAPAVQGIAGWTAMSRDDVQRCQAIFAKKGYPAVGGMERHSAMEYFAKLHMERPVFHQAWQAADLGGDGKLDEREFCLFVQLLRGAQKGWPLPARLSAEEAAALLGEAPMPAPPVQPAPVHIDAAHMRSVLHGQGQQAQQAVSRQASMEQSVIQDDSDGASSIDSGIAESVSGMSICSRPSAAPRMPGGPYALGRPSATPHRTGLGSVLGGGHGASATAGAYLPAAATGSAIARLVPYGSDADVAHNLLELTVHSAQIRYRKPLSTPIFSISVRDSLGRLVELPIDTHPGHYRRETATIHSSAIVRLASQLRKFPPGSVLFVEVKHWKSDKKRFSTLAWSYCPLDRLVDFGAQAARVRSGPVDLPLLKKPVDLTMRRAKRLTSRGPDLHISIRGVAE